MVDLTVGGSFEGWDVLVVVVVVVVVVAVFGIDTMVVIGPVTVDGVLCAT